MGAASMTYAIWNGFTLDMDLKILVKDQDVVEIDEYTQLVLKLNKPIKVIVGIEFTFSNNDGTLYDFYGIDHSFTLEFIEEWLF